MNVIEIKNMTKIFDMNYDKNNKSSFFSKIKENKQPNKFTVLNNINLTIKKGECIGVLGRNGAGKTTLFKLLAGILQPTSGTIKNNHEATAFLELGVGFEEQLTGRENIFIYGSILRYSKKEIEKKIDRIAEYAGVEKFLDAKLMNYSSGMKVRLAFAIAMINDPEVLLIDEIFAVGDQAFQVKSFQKIKELKRKGKTMLIITHSIDHVRKLCERSILLEKGKIMKQGETNEVINYYLKNVIGSERKGHNEKIREIIQGIENKKKIQKQLLKEIELTKKKNLLQRFSLLKLEKSLEKITDRLESQKDHLHQLTEETIRILELQIDACDTKIIKLKREKNNDNKIEVEEKIKTFLKEIKECKFEIIKSYTILLEYPVDENELQLLRRIREHTHSECFNEQEILTNIGILKEEICKTAERIPSLSEGLKPLYLNLLREETDIILKEKQEKTKNQKITQMKENAIVIDTHNSAILLEDKNRDFHFNIKQITKNNTGLNQNMHHVESKETKEATKNKQENIQIKQINEDKIENDTKEKQIMVRTQIQKEILSSIKSQLEDTADDEEEVRILEYKEILFEEYKNEKNRAKQRKLFKELEGILNEQIAIEQNTLKAYTFLKELIKVHKAEINNESEEKKSEQQGKEACHKIREFIKKIENEVIILKLKKEKLQEVMNLRNNDNNESNERIRAEILKTESEIILKKEIIKRLHQEMAMILDKNIQNKEIARDKGYGSHEIEIITVEFLNAERKETKVFKTGDKLIARINYFAYEKIKKPQFGIAIHSEAGLHINGPNTTFANQTINEIEGKGSVDYIIDSLPLLEGKYLFTAAVLNYTGEHIYDHHDKKFEFSIINTTKEKFGTIIIPSRWEYNQDTIKLLRKEN